MLNHALYSSSVPLELFDTEAGVFADGYLQDFAQNSIGTVDVSGDFIYLQRMPSGSVRQQVSVDFIYLQRMPSGSLRQQVSVDFIYLQRMNICNPKEEITLIWLMRARNTANTRYIYWRSPRTPNTTGIDKNTIRLDTVETIGSIYDVQ